MMNHDLAMYHSEFPQDLMIRALIEVHEVERHYLSIGWLLLMVQVRQSGPDQMVYWYPVPDIQV
jgi:hypothetical protein